MTTSRIGKISMGAAAALLLTFLFVQQRPVRPREHNRFVEDLRRMRQLDAEINRDLLRSQYELLSSYHPFVRNLEEMRRAEDDLKSIPTFIVGRDREQVEQLLKRASEVLSEKTRLLETFKSENVILKNSLRYFPVLMAEASQAAGPDTRLQDALASLLRDILLYELTPHSDLAGGLTRRLTKEANVLSHASVRPALNAILSSVSAHAQVITNVKPQVMAVTEKLNSLQTAQSIDAISAAYLRGYRHAVKISEIYRLLLFLGSMCLLGYGADRTVSLVKSRKVVEQANRQLHDTNAQLLQAKTELQRTNQMIELSVRQRTAELEREIIDRRVLEGQLVQSQKLESIGQLAAGIAHEINTPVQYVGDNIRFLGDAFAALKLLIGQFACFARVAGAAPDFAADALKLQIAAEDADMDYLLEEIPRAIDQSTEGVARVAGIVLAMKEFSHPGSADKELVDINRAIANTLTVCRNEWKYVAEVETDLDASLPPVLCLGGEINQMVLNLVVNAAHAIREAGKDRGEQGKIKVSTRVEAGWVEIRVQDNGTGIPAAIRSRIFTPFFTTKEVGKGTGQGLCLARTVVVKKHGGVLTFETEEGAGTTFIARLPLQPEMVAEKVA